MADVSPVRMGVIGLGRAFTLMLPSFRNDPRIALVAAADPRREARDGFVNAFGGRAYQTDTELCADAAVEAVYIASPHQFHAANVAVAAAAGKHIVVEKPMGLNLQECLAMAAAVHTARVHMVVGHSHSFDAPIRHARRLIADGTVGRVRMIQASYHTDFLYRPRRPEELDVDRGGGVVFNQAPHQVDIVRWLGGGLVQSVRALTGDWDAARPTEGAYAALLRFADGGFASLTYSGYARFDGDELCDWISEGGRRKAADRYGATRAALSAALSGVSGADPAAELAMRTARGFGAASPANSEPAEFHEHFGMVIASCERADLRPLPDRVMVYGDTRRVDRLPPPRLPRIELIDELVDAVRLGMPPAHDAAWGLATMETVFALRRSAASGQDVVLSHQVATRDD